MDIRITPRALRGRVAAIPSKSAAHRALICAALADGPTVLHLPSGSDDIDATIGCLRALGAHIDWQETRCTIYPTRAATEVRILHCAESGSTLRFLLPVAAALGHTVRFDGSGRLPERPLGALQKAMSEHGALFSSDRLPFTLSGRLSAGRYALPGDISSQYISGLLMALPLLNRDSDIMLTTPLASAGYVDMTLQALDAFGITTQRTQTRYHIPGCQRFHTPGTLIVEGDWSGAAFFLAAGALGGAVTVTGLRANAQGDRAILPLLQIFGARVETPANITVYPAPLRACEVDMTDIPDLLPILAVLAAAARGQTRFYNAARLRLKESDRLSAVAAMLRDLGGRSEERPDGLLVHGGPLRGGCVDGCGDHRIVMAAAIAAILCREPVIIYGAQSVEKSYPRFFADYEQLGGQVHVL